MSDTQPGPDDSITQPRTPEQTPDVERPEVDPEGRSPGEAMPDNDESEHMKGPAPSG